MSIRIIKSKDIPQEYENGFAQSEILPDTYPGMTNYKCFLKKGHTVSPKKYADKVVMYCFTRGNGYVTTPEWSRDITELSFFAPDFDNSDFSITAVEDMEFLCLVSEMEECEWENWPKWHLRLPWFTRMSECKEYVQDCKGPNTRSWSVLDPKYLGGVLMGIVRAEGEGTIEKGHPSVAQWNYALPGADFHLTVNDETVEQADGDFSYVTPGDDHSLVSDAGKLTYYIWYERRVYTEQSEQ